MVCAHRVREGRAGRLKNLDNLPAAGATAYGDLRVKSGYLSTELERLVVELETQMGGLDDRGDRAEEN